MLYFWKAECSRMSNMPFPCVNTIQLGPSPFNSSLQCKKSSLCHHFRRNSWIGWKKVTCTCSFLHVIFLFLVSTSPGPYFGQKSPPQSPLPSPKNGRVLAKNGKKFSVENCGTIYLYPKSKKNCSLFSSNFHVQRPVSRYGRLKLKFLWERFSVQLN